MGTFTAAASIIAACGSSSLDAISGPPGDGGDGATNPDDAGTSVAGDGAVVIPPSGDGSPTTSPTCKRGIATNTAPSAAFKPGVGWWYDWSLTATSTTPGIEFDPMVWGKASVPGPLPTGAKFVLGFNEPNFHAQSNLTPQQAASYWPTIEANAKAQGAPIVSPAMNFCGPAANCNGTDPYQYLKDFFAACPSCEVDYVAVHWYNCDLPSLQDYLEPGGNLEGFEQFGKPIWVTEISCDGTASAADQESYMRAAIPYLESKSNVFRYSWFSADPIPNAKLVNADGSPTALGQVYASLPEACTK